VADVWVKLQHDLIAVWPLQRYGPTLEDRLYSVHPPARLRVLSDNPLNDKQYADAIFLPLIAPPVAGRYTGTTP
jgi:hypothetical protein